jgi:hypothetical protein
MKKEARDQILRMFCENQNIQANSLLENLKTLISEAYAPFLLFVECLDFPDFKARNNPFDGFFINMLHRSTNVFGGMATLIASGHLQEAEALSRSLAESSLKIMHLCRGDVKNNVAQYLASYFTESLWKTKKWQEAVSNYDIHPHNKLIQDKNDLEEQAKEVCRMFVEESGCKWPEKAPSISAEKLFKDLDKELEYRTVYRAMCGQPHQNPEDIVNGLLSALSNNDDLEYRRREEKHCFSIFICLWGVRYYLESLAAVAKLFSFESVLVQATRATETIVGLQTSINNALKECKLSNGWVKNAVDGV